MNVLNALRRWVKRLNPLQKSAPPEKFTPAEGMLLQSLPHTREVELTCDEVFALLDEYADRAQRGENVAQLMPLVEHHLMMCPECREEYEALVRVLQAFER
ncbi:MAG: hypothetical protein HUU38_00495 [Anaerolineales bacterium]|nr:hypothetical protein [Anaerolineales bacterium]